MSAIRTSVHAQDLVDEAVSLVERWLKESADQDPDRAAKRLAGVLSDPNGLEFTVGFVDGVIRPEDATVAAKKLRELVPLTPRFLPLPHRLAIRIGGAVSRVLPGVVVPIARRVLRSMVSHLLVDASDAKLAKTIARLQGDGVHLNVNLLGEAILGDNEARRRLQGTERLLARDDIDYVSIKVSSVIAPHNHWAYAEALQQINNQLIPLYRRAQAASPPKFINLDMEEYQDLDITLDAFMQVLDRPEFLNLEAGIVLQAYLPDALSAMMRLQEWAAARVDQGGAPIKVRVVKGANLPMEHVQAIIRRWPLATWPTKQETDTSYKAVLDYALRPEHTRNVRVGLAGHNLFDIALAWLLANRRGVPDGVDIEMLLGMATGQAEVVKNDVGSLLLYTPVVHPEEFDVAIAYLIRRLEEGASQDNYMSAVFDVGQSRELFEREKLRFVSALEALTDRVPGPNRTQDRRSFDADQAHIQIEAMVNGSESFTNTPDSDPDLPANREWGREIADRMVNSRLGVDAVASAHVSTSEQLDQIIATGVAAASSWQSIDVDDRTRILHQAGMRLEECRAELLEVMGSECGKTLDQSDPEVSEAIDFAHFYASQGQNLNHVDGAVPRPRNLTVVTPPWNFPIAIPAGGALAALAAGSAVIIKPAPQAARVGAIMVDCLWQAGVPRDVLQMVQLAEDDDVSSALIGDERVGSVILTGAYDTAAAFRRIRQDVPLLAETSGKNAIIVTPNADFDLAARDVAQSAFGHAGQKCSAASLVILVGSARSSRRFQNQLLDAVRSLKVGPPDALSSQLGPVIAPPGGKLKRGLTTLEPGQDWIVEPHQIDTDHELAAGGKLWSPGVRTGVARGCEYHLTEYFGPILGVMTADTLDEAIDIVNDVDYGLTSGLQSLDRDELAQWLAGVHAGNLYVNRGITGAIVRRQPFGGWKRSAIGPGAKAGGPNYLYGLVDWTDAPVRTAEPDIPDVARPLLAAAEAAGISELELAWLQSAFASDAQAWRTEFGVNRDVSGLGVERNVFRYLPYSGTIRIASSATVAQAMRVLGAALAANAQPMVSIDESVSDAVTAAVKNAGMAMRVETDISWSEYLALLAAQEGADASARIRLVAGERDRAQRSADVYAFTAGKPDIALYAGPVVSAGRIEMLTHLHEQAVSITAHRFGTPDRFSEGVI